MDRDGGQGVARREFELSYPGLIRLHAAPLDGEAKGSTGMAFISRRWPGSRRMKRSRASAFRH